MTFYGRRFTRTRDKGATLDGQAIRRHRKAAGMTQQQLADAAGVSIRSIKSWEAGEGPTRTRWEHARRLAEIFGADRDEFLALRDSFRLVTKVQ